jgi:hypothetical protein
MRWNSFASKGLLGFRPSGYEISGLRTAGCAHINPVREKSRTCLASSTATSKMLKARFQRIGDSASPTTLGSSFALFCCTPRVTDQKSACFKLDRLKPSSSNRRSADQISRSFAGLAFEGDFNFCHRSFVAERLGLFTPPLWIKHLMGPFQGPVLMMEALSVACEKPPELRVLFKYKYLAPTPSALERRHEAPNAVVTFVTLLTILTPARSAECRCNHVTPVTL